MDGNGAGRSSGISRASKASRRRGSARVIIRTAGELGIKYLTLYAFSAENWNRPKDEVDALMKISSTISRAKRPELNKTTSGSKSSDRFIAA